MASDPTLTRCYLFPDSWHAAGVGTTCVNMLEVSHVSSICRTAGGASIGRKPHEAEIFM